MPKKRENIFQRSNGGWVGRYIKAHTAAEKTKYGYVYTRTYHKTKAKQLEAMSQSKAAQASAVPCGNTGSFSAAAFEWLDLLHPKVKESTYNKYYNLLNNYILPHYSEIQLQNITHEFIEAHCSQLLINGGIHQKGLSPKTVADTLSVLRSILKYASASGKEVLNDGRSVRIKHSAKKVKVLSRCEQAQLLSYLQKNPKNINIGIMLCLFTGMRIGEICALRWEDLSLSENTVYVHQTMQRVQNKDDSTCRTRITITSPKSPCSIRMIPLPDTLTAYISKHCVPSTGFFLTNNDQKYIEPRTMQNHFKGIIKECGLEYINYHVLRHTFATRCVELGFDVKTLSEILGHANVNITMNRYVHPTLELKKQNMQRLDYLFTVK